MSPNTYFVLAFAWVFAAWGFCTFYIFYRRKCINHTFLIILLIVTGIGSLSLAIIGRSQKHALFLQEAKDISINPKKWIAQEISDIDTISLSGTLTIIKKKVRQLEDKVDHTDNKEKIMIYSSAIDALQEQEECLRRLKNPAKCLVKD